MQLCLKVLCAKAFCAQCFLCKRLLSDSKSFLACRTAETSWEKLFEEMSKVDQCPDWMKTVEKNLSRWHVRRGEMRWGEVRWGEMSWEEFTWFEMRWSVESEVQVWSAECEECSAKCEESVCLALHCTGVAHRSCSWTTTAQQVRTKHARAWLAYGACKFYRWRRSYRTT